MYLSSHLIIDQLFSGSINTLGFYKNNLVISIIAALIDIEPVKNMFFCISRIFLFSYVFFYILLRVQPSISKKKMEGHKRE